MVCITIVSSVRSRFLLFSLLIYIYKSYITIYKILNIITKLCLQRGMIIDLVCIVIVNLNRIDRYICGVNATIASSLIAHLW